METLVFYHNPFSRGRIVHWMLEEVGALDNALSVGPFLLGERFTAADVYVGSQLGWGLATSVMETRPSFDRYIERCSERPAYRRSLAQCEELGRKLDLG